MRTAFYSCRLARVSTLLLLAVVLFPFAAFTQTTNPAASPEAGSRAEQKPQNLRFQPDPALPNVLLLGDSISIGYTVPVRTLLKGKANVFRPVNADGSAENCSDTGNGVAELDRWLAAQPKWEVIHFNWGLHDLKHMKPDALKPTTSSDPNDPPLRSVAEYRANLEKIVARLQQTGARLIFATTTPVPEGANNPYRSPADPAHYNAAAMEVMKQHGVRVNDLCGFIEPRVNELQRLKNVHFNAKGSEALAEQVAKTVTDELAANTEKDVVTYEAFGAAGDGVTDDLPAIRDAHAYANEHGLRIRSNPNATYHLGRRALTAIIATDTDWGISRFIIDDSQGVQDHTRPLFEVRSLLQPVPLKIDHLKRGQTRLNLRPPSDCLVFVENKNRKIFIRRGLNQNDGTGQKEVFILRRDGSIEGAIDWNYDVVTRVEARPIDPEPLVLRGGIFTNIANCMWQEEGYNYWSRNIRISRSNTDVDGLTLHVTGETEVGRPYGGFLSVEQCANITLRNCRIDGRKTYQTIGRAGKPVSMGTYGYGANLVVNFRMLHCRMEDMHDRTRWGVIGCNFMKNILIEDCALSRMDVHQGVSGDYIIRRTTLGHAGLNAIGRGRLIVEDSTLHGRSLIQLRADYGSTWEGEVLIRNSRWIPPEGHSGSPVMFNVQNDGTHDFGYPCFMPQVVRIEGLFVDDSKRPPDYQGITFFSDPLGAPREKRPFPYRLTERLEVRGLKTASGLPPRVCSNPEVTQAITVVLASDSPAGEGRTVEQTNE